MAGIHRALEKPPITPLSMIGPENHPLKLGAWENSHKFENKQHPTKSSASKEKISREMRKYFELMESEILTSQALWAVVKAIHRGELTAPRDEVRKKDPGCWGSSEHRRSGPGL